MGDVLPTMETLRTALVQEASAREAGMRGLEYIVKDLGQRVAVDKGAAPALLFEDLEGRLEAAASEVGEVREKLSVLDKSMLSTAETLRADVTREVKVREAAMRGLEHILDDLRQRGAADAPVGCSASIEEVQALRDSVASLSEEMKL